MSLVHMPRLHGFGILVVLLIAPVAFGESASAEGTPPELLRAPPADVAPSATESTAGWRVFLDPVTGEILSRPSSEQVRRLQQAIDELDGFRAVIDLHPFYLPSGGTGVYVGDRFMTSTVVRRARDGSLVVDCTTDPSHLLHRHPPLAPVRPQTARSTDAPVM